VIQSLNKRNVYSNLVSALMMNEIHVKVSQVKDSFKTFQNFFDFLYSSKETSDETQVLSKNRFDSLASTSA